MLVLHQYDFFENKGKLMRKLFLMMIGATALLVSGAASAIPITVGLTLSDPTGGQGLCEVDCVGTITIDVTSGPITSTTNGSFEIIDLNIEITDGNSATPTGLTFGSPFGGFGFNFATISNGSFTDFYATHAFDQTGTGILSLSGSDWTVTSGFLGISGGGSGSAIPEPSALALLGIGLLGFGAATRRKRRNNS